jgi:hypothetical protein
MKIQTKTRKWFSKAELRKHRAICPFCGASYEPPGFWTGVDSMFDWSDEIDYGRRYDPSGIFNDWRAVGDDLRNAFDDIERRKTSPV